MQDWPTPSTEVIAYLPSVVLAVRAARITFLYRSEGYAMRALFFSGLLRATEYMSWDKVLLEATFWRFFVRCGERWHIERIFEVYIIHNDLIEYHRISLQSTSQVTLPLIASHSS